MGIPARYLIFNATLVLLVGLLCGIPYGRAILRNKSEALVRAWRLAHGSLIVGAALMLGVAAVFPQLSAETIQSQWVISLSFIVSGYGFCVSLTLAPVVGHRGLSIAGPASAKLVYLGNIVGAGFSLLGTLALAYATLISL
jgi:hypothetical protein